MKFYRIGSQYGDLVLQLALLCNHTATDNILSRVLTAQISLLRQLRHDRIPGHPGHNNRLHLHHIRHHTPQHLHLPIPHPDRVHDDLQCHVRHRYPRRYGTHQGIYAYGIGD